MFEFVAILILLLTALCLVGLIVLRRLSPCYGCIVLLEGNTSDCQAECHAFLAYQKRTGRR